MIGLINPKYRNNLSQVIRCAYAYGINKVYYSGNRVNLKPGERIPREERMYREVEVIQDEFFYLHLPTDIIPIGVELIEGAESMLDFEHKENMMYLYGAEDNSLPPQVKRICHRLVEIPSYVCLNLSHAVVITLYDRELKRHNKGNFRSFLSMGDRRRFDLLIGMHPDEATDVIREAANRKIPFIIVPCCVKPYAYNYCGSHKFHAWVHHLEVLAERLGYETEKQQLKMSGKNIAIIGRYKNGN